MLGRSGNHAVRTRLPSTAERDHGW